MLHAVDILVHILRNAWTAILGLMVAVGCLAALAELLKLSGSAALGTPFAAARAAGALLGLIVVLLYAYLAVPAIVRAVSGALPRAANCGPAAELGQAAAYAMAGITALRLARAAIVSLVSASGGAASGISYAIREAAEAVVGMLLISLAAPMSAAFLGACR